MFRFFLAILLATSLGIQPIPCVTETEEVSLPIVMYHHMAEEPSLLGKYVISPEELEEDLLWLQKEGYESVTVPELIAWEKGEGTLPEKPVMLTFDDGFESTGVYAGPLLEKYGYTAEVAVIGSVAQRFSDEPDHHLAYSHLNWEALNALEQEGILHVQCHTWDMHRLKPRQGCSAMKGETEAAYREKLSEDLTRFQTVSEEKLGKKAEALMLPYGFVSPATRSLAAELGFQAVFTCTEQVNHLRRTEGELLSLGRYNRPSGVSSEEFFSQWQKTL